MDEEEEPPLNETVTFLMLPNDLVINCLARVSRLYYPILSLVSKRFRSFLASPELYKTRELLGRTESCLYVCLQLKTIRWFTLSWKPNGSRRILVPISSPNSPSLIHKSSVAAVRSTIYVINGLLINNNKSNEVMVIDCGSHTWHEAPSMHVSPSFPRTCVLDGKIYVKEHYDPYSTKPMEVFDTKTQTWKSIPWDEICKDVKHLAFDKEWVFSSSYCMIENVLYRYSYQRNNIEWYDQKERLWKMLKGLERFAWPWLYFKLVDHGGKIVVLSKKCDMLDWKKPIWCGEIAIERRQKDLGEN